MIGAILGDMIGSPYEFDQGDKTKDFVFWNPRVRFTDDSVMTIAVSLGGDCDTLTCIAGGMAEAFYGVPEEMADECRKRLPKDILGVLERFGEMR